MYRISGHWKLGLALATITALFWGLLPIALTVTLRAVDPYTLTWFRFLTATLMLCGALAVMGKLPKPGVLGGRGWIVFALALAGIVGNFVLYVIALGHASPTINQVVGQLSPILLMLGGIVVFHERFSVVRWVGFGLLLIGLPLFFNKRLPELMQPRTGLGLGVALLVIGAFVWAIYGLAQKWLLRKMQAQQILLLVYAGSTIVLFPVAHPAAILKVDALQAWMLAFACANTVVAYGAFAEALKHWEASRVAATLCLTPLFTLIAMWVLEHALPGFVKPEQLNSFSVLGAMVVVGGSMLCALGTAPPATSALSPQSTPPPPLPQSRQQAR